MLDTGSLQDLAAAVAAARSLAWSRLSGFRGLLVCGTGMIIGLVGAGVSSYDLGTTILLGTLGGSSSGF